MRRLANAPLAPLAILGALGAGGCRTPTEWRLIVHSDVPCGASPEVVLFSGADAKSALGGAPRAFAATCEGRVDDVYLVPEGDTQTFVAALATRVDGGDPTLCRQDDPPTGCVVQTWRLSFHAHSAQTFETTLSKSCADVRCGEGFTCVRPGVCVSDAPPTPCEDGCRAEQSATTAPVDVYAAGGVTCVRDGLARVTCWGDGSSGVLGRGSTANAGDVASTTPDALGPIDFGLGRSVARFALAADHACAILDDATLRCWGANAQGQLGYGDTSPRGDAQATLPGKLAAIGLGAGRTARDVAVGLKTTCAVLDDGSLKCWGGQTGAELGYGDATPRGGTPATVPAVIPAVPLGVGRTAKRVAIGSSHVCVVRDDDALVCWGTNAFGELGYGDTSPRGDTPATTPAQLAAVSLGAGRTAARPFAAIESTCVLTSGQALVCWGIGGNGILGAGDPSTRGDTLATIPAKLPDLAFGAGVRPTAFSMGDTFACAALSDGGTRCWGSNEAGELGYGDTTIRGLNAATVPASLPSIPLPAGRTIRSLGLGTSHACALFDDASVRCWGRNASGQLGYGDTSPRGDVAATTPLRLPAVKLPK